MRNDEPRKELESARSRMTDLLVRSSDGDEAARGQLFEQIQGELKGIAFRQIRKQGGRRPLNPTTMVQELCVRFLEPKQLKAVGSKGRAYFFQSAAQAMHELVVDEVRKRAAAKRGKGQKPLSLTAAIELPENRRATRIEDLHQALSDLERLDSQQAKIVKLRFFVGLKTEEVAETLGLNVAMVRREWAMAKAWLALNLAG